MEQRAVMTKPIVDERAITANYPEYWIDEYLFADDPFVTAEARQKSAGKGLFSFLLTLHRGGDGVLRAVRDIKVERCTNNCTGR